MKPTIHAQSSAKRYGGKAEDYIDIHQFMDSSKAHFPTNAHRALFHSSFGCFIVEQVFGLSRVNSEGRSYSTRDVAETHIIEDLGFIPTVADYLSEMTYCKWMHGDGLPPSQKKKEEKVDISKIVFDGSQPLNIPQTDPPKFDDIIKPSILDRNQLID